MLEIPLISREEMTQIKALFEVEDELAEIEQWNADEKGRKGHNPELPRTAQQERDEALKENPRLKIVDRSA